MTPTDRWHDHCVRAFLIAITFALSSCLIVSTASGSGESSKRSPTPECANSVLASESIVSSLERLTNLYQTKRWLPRSSLNPSSDREEERGGSKEELELRDALLGAMRDAGSITWIAIQSGHHLLLVERNLNDSVAVDEWRRKSGEDTYSGPLMEYDVGLMLEGPQPLPIVEAPQHSAPVVHWPVVRDRRYVGGVIIVCNCDREGQ